jgi:DNA-binding NarL/FixJ family response regulator
MSEPTVDVIGVVVIDDHKMVAEVLGRMLAEDAGIDLLGVASSGGEGIELVDRLRPQVVLVDYQMPDQDGVSVTAEIKRRHPETIVVMLTGSIDDRILLAAIDAGCSGFLTKDRAALDVVAAVHGAAAGEALVSPAMLARLLPKLNKSYRAVGADLTPRERELLELVARGWTNKVIASELKLSVNTVRNYVQSVLTKLSAHSKLEAVATAVREGLIDYPSTG